MKQEKKEKKENEEVEKEWKKDKERWREGKMNEGRQGNWTRGSVVAFYQCIYIYAKWNVFIYL